MSEHPTFWARIKIIDLRPVWSGKLRSALKAVGFGGEIDVAINSRQLLKENVAVGPTLYLVGDCPFEKAGFPDPLLDLLASKPCKVVFLKSDIMAFSSLLERRKIEFAKRPICGDGDDLSTPAIARKLLQFEPKPQAAEPMVSPKSGQLKPTQPGRAATEAQNARSRIASRRISVIGLGASTGGVEALQVVLRDLPASLPPILIVQHSRSTGGNRLAKVLGRSTAIKVVSAQNNMPLTPGCAYVATGSEHHLRLGRDSKLVLQLVTAPSVSGHRPSVDVMFESLSELGNQVAAVLLTGMGQDGAVGLKRIRDRGGWAAAQDQESSLVYGMPRAAAECGAVEEQLSLTNVAPRLVEICQR